MSYNGSGTFNINSAGQPVVSGTVISSTAFNALTNDLATGLTTAITKDGQTTPTANLPMGGFKLTGLAAATAAADSARLSTVQNSQGQQLGTIAGTNTITAVGSPTVTAYAAGQTFRFTSAGANTGATTLNIDSLGAKNVYWSNAACTGGEIANGATVTATYDGTQFQLATNYSFATATSVQNSQGTLLGTIAGTNTITAAATPTLTAYTAGQTFRFSSAGANTGATTLNINSLGAKNIFYIGSALVGSEIPASGMVTVTYDGTQFNLTASAAAGSSPFTDATAIIKNSVDATKLIKISAASVATGTTRTYTGPNKDGTLAMIADIAFMPLTASVGASALTATLAAETNLNFNDGTSASTTAAITVTASSGSTLGTISAQRSRVWVIAVKNSGTPELAIFNALSGTKIAAIPLGGTISTTAEGGAGAADSAQVWYSTTARASQPFCVVGYIESTQATAGTWASAPTAQGYGPGIKLPADIIQTTYTQTGAAASGSTTIPWDDTIPQNTEGDQYMTLAITPTSAANVLDVVAYGNYGGSANVNMTQALFQDAVANALAASVSVIQASNIVTNVTTRNRMVAATTSSTTMKTRTGPESAATLTFNGASGGTRKMGGVMSSNMTINEVMV